MLGGSSSCSSSCPAQRTNSSLALPQNGLRYRSLSLPHPTATFQQELALNTSSPPRPSTPQPPAASRLPLLPRSPCPYRRPSPSLSKHSLLFTRVLPSQVPLSPSHRAPNSSRTTSAEPPPRLRASVAQDIRWSRHPIETSYRVSRSAWSKAESGEERRESRRAGGDGRGGGRREVEREWSWPAGHKVSRAVVLEPGVEQGVERREPGRTTRPSAGAASKGRSKCISSRAERSLSQ